MKNKIGKVVIILMAVITTISMSACSKINNETASDVCNALKAKYGEDFEVSQIGDRLNTSTATTYVHPVNNSEIVFTAKIDHSGNVVDDYVNNIVMYSIEKELVSHLGNSGITAAANAVVTEDDVIETDKSIDPNSFVTKNGIESVLVRLIIDYKSESAESIITALEKATAKYGFDLVISMYFVNHDAFLQCDSDFRTYPSVGATRIESYSLLYSAKTVLTNGKSTVTVSELEAILEGK